MFRNSCVSSLLIFSLLIISCQKNEKTIKKDEYISISGLLTAKDTVTNYDEIGLKKLSDYGFFNQPLNQLIPATRQVVPYELNSPLFTDYASKKRFISFPEGTSAKYKSDEAVLTFPTGTIIIKNFYYKNEDLKTTKSDVIIETRLLIKDEKNKWKTIPYIWNEEQTEAYLYILGKDIDLVLEKNTERKEKVTFKYSVPNINMCKNCHVKNQDLVPLGPTPRQMHRDNLFEKETKNQLAYLKENNFIEGLSSVSVVKKLPNYQDKSKTITNRARAYLDVNCAHCHQEKGSAKTSGLHLMYQEENYYKIGVNKPPVAAGKGSGNLAFDIVVGKPNESILLYRMKHLEPDIVMPEIGKNLVHKEGVKLIEDWIASMEE
ncbi:MAG: SO2930 family diheme c-type cytochrome [Polaribacter sp.]|uniref:SO2930 family diheme c-type cytochrome n=1 Tax=Polaribacter sp. TaxID=1920175 RepID=UPI002F350B71